MANIPIWTGTATFTSGSSTPFGFYDSDLDFQVDAPKGHPRQRLYSRFSLICSATYKLK